LIGGAVNAGRLFEAQPWRSDQVTPSVGCPGLHDPVREPSQRVRCRGRAARRPGLLRGLRRRPQPGL